MSEEKEPMIEGNLFNLENTQGVFQTKIENGVYGDQMQWMQPFLRKMYQWTHPVTFNVKIIKVTDNLYSVTLNSSDKESKRITFAATDLQNAILEAKALADFLNIPFDNDCDNAYRQAKDLQDKIDNKSNEP